MKNAFNLSLKGLSLAPSQVWGGVRLVPVLRENAPGDLRLKKRFYGDNATHVSLEKNMEYLSYIPHALVASWSDDESPAAPFGTNLQSKDGKTYGTTTRVHRMRRRETGNQLRFLPLHLAMEGFLSLQFGGPEIAWEEYSKNTMRRGLGERVEYSYSGHRVAGLDDALRVFEIHEHQVGTLVFVADTLASAFVVSHPDDYRQMHRTLLEDFYGELMMEYGLLYSKPALMHAQLDTRGVKTFDDLEKSLSRMKDDWASFHEYMSDGLFGRTLKSENLYRAGPFQLLRFTTDLDVAQENHIGEAMVRQDGTLEYLKTFRLSGAQTRRAFLLNKLAEYRWNLDAAALSFKQTKEELILRLEKAGFGYLLQEHILNAALRQKRR